MSTILKANNTETPCEAAEHYRDSAWGRPTCTVTLAMSVQEAASLLPTGIKWSLVERAEGEDDYTRDMSDYSLSGDITDHRDGRVSIKMGKPTEEENAVGTVVALTGEAVTMERAAELRPVIEAAAVSLSDGEAAKSPELITRWADHIGETVAPGDRRSDEDESGVLRVYKVREGQGHTTQENWPPHSTPAMWTIINVDHAGTQDDPIPASRGMEYTYGLYYKDPEDTKLYLCERTGEQSGNKITLQYLPHELVGNYFTAV